MSDPLMNRRELIAALAAAAALPLLPACGRTRATTPASPSPTGVSPENDAALALLSDVGENLLAHAHGVDRIVANPSPQRRLHALRHRGTRP